MAKAVCNFNVETSIAEGLVYQIFKARTVYVELFISARNFYIGHEDCRIKAGIGDTSANISTCNPNFVQDLTVRGNCWLIRLAPQDIDCAAC